MKPIYIIFLFSIAVFTVTCSGSSSNTNQKEASEHHMDEHQHETKAGSMGKKAPASPKKEAMAMIGTNHVHIEYSSPSVRGRKIWGGLVPYGKVWVTGAHKATSINFPQAVVINGKDIPAGKYGFFTIPGEHTWTVILNKTWDMHQADNYNKADDAIRFEVTPEKLDALQEALEYKVVSTGDDSGIISVAWEYLKISFAITNKS